MKTFDSFKAEPSSEKITLATMDASKRLMGWTQHAGQVYKIALAMPVIVSLAESGNEYNEVESIDALTSTSFFHDRDNKLLYVKSYINPNGRFFVVKQRLFFASSPVTLPYDLASGFEVFWEPMVQGSSQFGVELDTIEQATEAIEGSGTLTLHNDFTFWPACFDKLTFENGEVNVYAYNRDLPPSEAKLLFAGKVESKNYSSSKVAFKLKDTLSVLKANFQLPLISSLGQRTASSVANAYQRMVFGKVSGHVGVNLDEQLDGYPIAGTVTATFDSMTVTGSGTNFLLLSPDDEIVLGEDSFTVASVLSATSLTLTEEYDVVGGYSGPALLRANRPKRWMNRKWTLAGHALREPVTYTEAGSTISLLIVTDASDIEANDYIYIGTLGAHELVQVAKVVGKKNIYLRTSLLTVPSIGTKVTRPCVQNVRIDDLKLTYYRDYTFDAATGTLTLRGTAESNSSPVRIMTSNVAFTTGSRTVTGSGFKGILRPGDMLGTVNQADYFEILSIESDTSLTLRTPSTFSSSNQLGRYRSLVFDPNENTLSVDLLGRTEDGQTNGRLLKTGPQVVRALLKDLGLTERIDSQTFDLASDISYFSVGLVIPEGLTDTKLPTYRDTINKVNKSVFGNLIQNQDFKLAYTVLEPRKGSALRLDEADIIDLKFDATAVKAVKTVVVEYSQREYDYLTGQKSVRTQQQTSDEATHVLKLNTSRTFTTYLVNEAEAELAANRWSFILERGAGRATVTTKLQGISLQVGDVVQVSHRKLFERIGTQSKTRLFMVEAVKKNAFGVEIEMADLSGAFARVACFSEVESDYADANETERLYSGFWTDDFGLIENDPETFGLNLIW